MSIADKLNYLITTKGLLKDNINKINNVLTDQSTFRSYPQELFNGYLDVLNNGTDTLWNNLEKVSATGEEATLENVETAPIKIMLNGNTSQETTTGKNLLNVPNGTTTSNGITGTITDNCILTYSGIATGSYANISATNSMNLPEGTYTFSIDTPTTNNERIVLYMLNGTAQTAIISGGTTSKTFVSNGTNTNWRIGITNIISGTEYSGVVKIQLESGSTATSWEKYTGGQPSPNPDYPQQVKVVKGENVVSVQGKQLLDTSVYSLGSINGNTGQNEESSSVYRFDKYNEVKPNTTIYLLKHLCIYFYNENKGFISSNITGNLTITTPPNTKYIRFRIFGADFSTFNPNDYMVSYTQETHFVPYSKTDYPISLGNLELCKIGDYKDYFHKDSGKWYKHKVITKRTLNFTRREIISSRTWFWSNKPSNSIDYGNFTTNTITEVAQSLSNISSKDIAFTGNGAKAFYGISYKNTYENIPTLAELQEKVNGKSHYYVLATPTEEEITNTTLIEQLEAISKAKSVKDKTYITQTNEELPFILDVEAIKEYEVN